MFSVLSLSGLGGHLEPQDGATPAAKQTQKHMKIYTDYDQNLKAFQNPRCWLNSRRQRAAKLA